LTYVCMAEYDATMPNVTVAFPPEDVDPTLGGTLAAAGLKQLRIAETEKYAHVTFFFNGGVEEPNPGEDRILIPSPKVATYDLQPEMSAPLVASTVIDKINQDAYDVYILNFANPDMVGHTGVFDAAVSAIETLDGLVGQIRDAVLAHDGQILLTADHGNADTMLDAEGNPVTKHSTALVPLCHICREPMPFTKTTGKLADIAPTLLTMMGLEVPSGMEGDVLV
ncbi:MAG: alkaline phosphatase family protein, partial [Mogibacterium sp.]|nr:alkaline phosphatase family protein [Mogibacterium sp.]